MRVVLLDGSSAGDDTAGRVHTLLEHEMQNKGWQVEHILLRDQKIGNCAGDFFCWFRDPGICNVNDDNRVIAEAIINSDLVVYMTPVTFGGYSSTLKRMVDHQIQNISPYFARVAGETHHQKRYDKYPDFLAVGWMPQADEQSAVVFKQLCSRNAINFYAKRAVSGVVLSSQADDEILTALRGLLSELGGSSKPLKETEAVNQWFGEEAPIRKEFTIRRALLLVGSPRTRKSSSNALGGYILEHLQARSIQTETIYIHTILRSSQKLQAFIDSVDAADLVLLAFPLYVDSLPAPVIEALEILAEHRKVQGVGKPALFAALANCGFPEAAHNATALAICELFARQAGFDWAGSLSLGAGEGLVHGAPLKDASGPAVPIKMALDMAAEALAQGASIPESAAALLAKPIIPSWLYRILGGIGWRQQARKYGVQKLLRRKTYISAR